MQAGRAAVFIRFVGCNMRCSMEAGPKSPGGFDCDTEFESGTFMSANAIRDSCLEESGHKGNQLIVLTGGEPGLQVDTELVDKLHRVGFFVQIETNGSVEVCPAVDWVTVSPKVAEHAIRQKTADEVKYVRGYGQAIPKTAVNAKNKLISPATNGLCVDRRTIAWCIDLVKKNPEWRLSVQLHKDWGVR